MKIRYRLVMAMILPALVAPLGSCTSLGASAQGERLARVLASPQHNGEKFVNKLPRDRKRKKRKRSLFRALGMYKRYADRDKLLSPKETLNVQALSAGDFGAPATDLTVRWFGHSTILIEMEGKRVLTDPIWSNRASPVSFAGPERFYPPLIDLEDLPPIDAVVISHDHYDHLDYDTIVALNERAKTVFFVPLGVGAHLEAWGVDPQKIHELDWWEERTVGGLRIVCTPARHFSGRSFDDRDRTLWASWSILGKERRVYFSGDTGLFPEMEEIGRRLGPFDITMIESGAYNQRWTDNHLGPEQAVIAHRALRGKVMLPIHWGLFNLAWHTWTEPIERLRVVAERDGDRIAQPRPGTLLVRGEPIPTQKWWPEGKWQTAEEYPIWSSNIEPAWREKYWLVPASGEGRLARSHDELKSEPSAVQGR